MLESQDLLELILLLLLPRLPTLRVSGLNPFNDLIPCCASRYSLLTVHSSGRTPGLPLGYPGGLNVGLAS